MKRLLVMVAVLSMVGMLMIACDSGGEDGEPDDGNCGGLPSDIVNGNFESSLASGWNTDYGETTELSEAIIERTVTTGDADGDYELHLLRISWDSVSVKQDICYTPGSGPLEMDVNVEADGNHTTAGWYASLIIRVTFLDSQGSALGTTALYIYDGGYPNDRETETLHEDNILANGGWTHIVIDYESDLNTYLTGVNPNDIAGIRIQFVGWVSWNSPGAWVAAVIDDVHL